MEFNEKLKELRIKNNLTQDDLADKLHLARQSISKWEQGINEPNIEMLKKLAAIFNVSLSELLSEEEKTSTTKDEKMHNIERKIFIGNCALAIFTLLLAAILIRMMPATLPMHYDFAGNVTRYGSKWETLLFLLVPLIIISSSALIHFSYGKNKYEKYIATGFVPTQIMLLVVQVLFAGFYIWFAFHSVVEIQKVIMPSLVGIFNAAFIILSIFSMPYFNKKRNPFFGFRTNFTFTSDEGWYKVNRFQSYSGLIASSIAFILTLITFQDWNLYLLGLIIISIVPTLIYHEVLRKKLAKK